MMQFPFYFYVGSIEIHPHFLFEALAYFIGFRIYLYTRNKNQLSMDKAIWVIIGAAAGAFIGSKLLFWFEDPIRTWNEQSLIYLLQGKTIVGGLLGGLIGVEWTKNKLGITRSTGDEMVFPLIIAIAIGRVGCFLTGLSDHTYGTQTTWWTGIDFGDGIMRHPTQLYEIVFLLLFGTILFVISKKIVFSDGFFFQVFMVSYLSWRFFIDFIKPTPDLYLNLNNVQIACLLGLFYYIWRWVRERPHLHKRVIQNG